MTVSVAVLGGDYREIRVAELLMADGHDVAIFGSDAAASNGMSTASSVEKAVSDREWIVCPAPGLGENDQLYAPDAASPICLTESLLDLSAATKGGVVLGKSSPTLADACQRLGIPIHEFKEDRALAVVVGSAVAEAVVANMVRLTTRIFSELNVLVLGYGATGSAITDALVALRCRTWVASRNGVQLEIARRRGSQPVPFEEWPDVIEEVDVIVNTVPHRETIGSHLFPALVDKTVIDISSPPGGLDHVGARESGVSVVWARGLAGQRAPMTIGEAQFDFIRKAISTNQANSTTGPT